MAYAQVQSKIYGSTASSTSHSVTLDAAPTTGNLLILAVVSDTTVSATPTGWSVAASAVDFTGTYLYYRVVTAGLSATTTVNLTSSDSCVIQVFEYSGLLGSPFDKVASAIGQGPTTTTVNTGTTVTTTQANELLFAVVGISGTSPSAAIQTPSDVSAWSNSFVQQGNGVSTGSTVNIRGVTATFGVSATGTYTTTATLVTPTDQHNSGIIATFNVSTAYALNVFAHMCEFNVQRLA